MFKVTQYTGYSVITLADQSHNKAGNDHFPPMSLFILDQVWSKFSFDKQLLVKLNVMQHTVMDWYCSVSA